MSDLHIKAGLNVNDGIYHIGLSLIEFKEDDVTIIYSPALDLSGYGQSEEEAKKSFFEVLSEFFRYTNNKKTLDKVLNKLGWSIKGSKKKPKFSPPKDSELVASNPLYNEIVNKKAYKVSRENIEFAF